MIYSHCRAFDRSSIDYLFQSSGKLQRLAEISKEYGIGLQSQKGDGSYSVKKMVVFATTAAECEIIQLGKRKTQPPRPIGYLPDESK